MKKQTSNKPFLIKDSKNLSNYYTLLYGLLSNEVEPVKLALKNKAQINKLFIEESGDVERYQYSEDDDRGYNLIPALEFAQKKCKAIIFKEIMKTCSLDDKSKANIVFKALAQVKEDEDISQNKDLQETIRAYIDKKNINKYYPIKSLSDPMNGYSWRKKDIEATFIHVAAETLNKDLIKALADLGANVNLKTKGAGDGDCRTAGHIVIDKTPNKGVQDFGVNCLLTLFDLGINCDLKNRDKENIWEAAVAKFKIPQLKIIFANKQPLNLGTIEGIKRKSPHLYAFWQKKSPGFVKYPLINDIFKYENLNITLGDGFNKIDNIEAFFKHKSLKKALDQRYKFSSSRLCSIITNNLFQKNEATVYVKPQYLQVVDLAYYIFMDNKNPNTSDFLEVLEKNSKNFLALVNDIDYSYRYNEKSEWKKSAKQLLEVLNKIYTSNQLKQVLTNDEKGLEDSAGDIVEMYKSFPKELDLILKRTKFSEINNLQSLHDFLSGETNALEQENFKLEQEKFKPELKKISDVKMSLGYGVKLAEENHDLIRWGAMMGHCVGGGSYAKEAKQGETIIMAITKDSEPSYCVEVSPKGEIVQVQGKSRSTPTPELMEEFVSELKKIGILNKKQKAKGWT